MILILGPTGAGKSVQAKRLCINHDGLHWVSVGQLLRDLHSPEVETKLESGHLMDMNFVNTILDQKISEISDDEEIVMDGFPRMIEQAEWLEEALEKQHRKVTKAIYISLPESEIKNRLLARGRSDDTEASIEAKLIEFDKFTMPVIGYFREKGILVEVDGMGTKDEVGERIEGVYIS